MTPTGTNRRTGNRDELERVLARIDHRPYKAYKELTGSWDLQGFRLSFDHVQGDPFAAPSRVRVEVAPDRARFPDEFLGARCRRIALEDFLIRQFHRSIGLVVRGRRGTGHSGQVRIDCGGQEVLERSAMHAGRGGIEARFTVGLPAAGRTILGSEAREILLGEIPELVSRSLLHAAVDQGALREFVETVEDQETLRSQLADRRLVGFLADGALLPRRSGVDDRPLPDDGRDRPVRLVSPESLRCTLDTPHRGPVSGMAIPQGITLIVGGGFHGKSTLLNAVERGIYNHVPGDGREGVVTVPGAFKVRAEDGRRVENVPIHPFIADLPFGKDTVRFRTDNASGSTSQAAAIIEALEIGADLLLMDEDTSATNFMIRDGRMQKLVAKRMEPITPFVDRVRQIYVEHGVSTLLVMGGCGDYFEVADRVLRMESYLPRDVTGQAREVAGAVRTQRNPEGGGRFGPLARRRPRASSFDSRRGNREVKIDVRGLRTIVYGRTQLDLTGLEQIVDPSQTRAIGAALHHLADEEFPTGCTLKEGLDRLFTLLEKEGLDALDARKPGNLAMPRRLETGAAVNRLRTLRVD